MDNDEKEIGYRFRSPAPETLKRLADGDLKFQHFDNCMNDLNTNLKLMQKDIQVICEKLDEHTIQNNKDIGELTESIKSLKNVMLWVGGLIIAGVIAAIFKLILK